MIINSGYLIEPNPVKAYRTPAPLYNKAGFIPVFSFNATTVNKLNPYFHSGS